MRSGSLPVGHRPEPLIRVGIGGWTFAPWRGRFYPTGLPHGRELAHASRQVTAIEINGTFYRAQNPATFRTWRDETPDGFVFAVKGHRAVTNRKALSEAGPALETFLNSGLTELGDKLGPINWQLAPTKRFDPDEMAAFLALLPPERAGRPLSHAIEVRHASFAVPAFVDLARRHRVAIVCAESDAYPAIADSTGDFVYARLQRSRPGEPDGYPGPELDAWAERARTWQAGAVPPDLPRVGPEHAAAAPRDVFVFFISGEKAANPAAALSLLRRLG
ncbi:DUF72 domain-containing protein [Enterovirga sp.]|uniref:DUF72 domain-containing protein n=1 Tax=Enterovirga sp. TaxID=2026350 RepID=UPI00261FDFA3|nr:DUF72 domain-containing protein [Enterovirga sp.]MDB5592818.1 hypothetical protein [Enterovirga sp.]